MKLYIDKVIEHGWAYGSKGTALKGKCFLASITTGVPENGYSASGIMKHTVEEFSVSLEGFANTCQIDYKKLFSLGGAMCIPGVTTEEQKQALIDKCKKQADNIIECISNL